MSASREDHCSISCDAILKAADQGTQALTKYLAEKSGKNRFLAREIFEASLQRVAYARRDKAVQSLLDIGVDPKTEPSYDFFDYIGDSIGAPLQSAVSAGNIKIAKILLKAGADVNARCVLEMAGASSLEMLRFILEEGADVKTYGGPALVSAIQHEKHEAFQLLLLFGADINASNGKFTALTNAIYRGYIKLVKILLDAGADVNKDVNNSDSRAIKIAAENGKIEMVKILLDADADVNGWSYPLTALQYAARKGKYGAGKDLP